VKEPLSGLELLQQELRHQEVLEGVAAGTPLRPTTTQAQFIARYSSSDNPLLFLQIYFIQLSLPPTTREIKASVSDPYTFDPDPDRAF
jgi:hypothetical protein